MAQTIPAESETGGTRPPRAAGWALRLASGYGLLVVLAAALSRAGAERFWWSMLALYVPQAVYALPALVTVPLAAAARDGRALGLGGLTLLFVGLALMGFRAPAPGLANAPGHPGVRVLAYNIKGGIEDFPAIRGQVAGLRPDVAVLSEARGWSDDEALRRRLDQLFPGWDVVQEGDLYVASRWRIVERDAELLGAYEQDEPHPTRYKVRALVAAPFGRFNLVGAHLRTALRGQTLLRQRGRLPAYLDAAHRVRQDQAEDLVRWTAGLPDPVVLAGDFNTPPAGMVYGTLRRRFTDAFATAGLGWGFTYPSAHPLLRIDYVFCDRSWRVRHCQVGGARGSDHRPVLAELVRR